MLTSMTPPAMFAGFDSSIVFRMIIQKVTSFLLPYLKEVDILFKYPLNGKPTEAFEVEDGSNLAVFILRGIDAESELLCFAPLEEGNEAFVFNTVREKAQSVSKYRVVEEGRWWLYRPKRDL